MGSLRESLKNIIIRKTGAEKMKKVDGVMIHETIHL